MFNEPETILIVDDDLQLRLSLTLILRRKQYRILHAEDGLEALHELGRTRVDLVILDLSMAGMSGQKALPVITHRYPDVPVLILTANLSMEAAIRALDQGAAGYLLKPADPAEIIQRIGTALRERKEKLIRKRIEEDLRGITQSINRYEMED